MNLLNAAVLLLSRTRSRKVSLDQLDERMLNDIGLCRHDIRSLSRRAA